MSNISSRKLLISTTYVACDNNKDKFLKEQDVVEVLPSFGSNNTNI